MRITNAFAVLGAASGPLLLTALIASTGCSSSGNPSAPTTAGAGGSGPATGSGSSTTGSSTTSTGSTTTTGGSGGGPGIIPPRVEPGSCGLMQPAFCEKFNTPQPGGRGGDLDETLWSFSRWAHQVQYLWVRVPAATYGSEYLFPSTFCGQPFSGIMPPNDVRMCEGKGVDGMPSLQLNEVFDDEGDFAFHSMRIRQLFDFTDRTGTIVWDVDAKVNPLNTGHGWWFELWITEDPAPMPYHEAPTVTSLARKSLGFAFRFGDACPQTNTAWQSGLETVHVTDDYKFVHAYQDSHFTNINSRCFKVADAHLNHFELHVSKDRAELWASDYDDPSSFKQRGVIPQLDLTFTRGYVHFQHAQYNASKDGHVTRSQTFRWDNIGFDGPTYPTPRGYDVAENTEQFGDGTRLGWYLDDGKTHTITVPNVDLNTALSASFNFDVMLAMGQTIEYSFNGKPVHSFTVPMRDGSNMNTSLRGFTLDAPLSELVNGNNTITVRALNPNFVEGIGNVDLTIEVPQ